MYAAEDIMRMQLLYILYRFQHGLYCSRCRTDIDFCMGKYNFHVLVNQCLNLRPTLTIVRKNKKILLEIIFRKNFIIIEKIFIFSTFHQKLTIDYKLKYHLIIIIFIVLT